MSLSFRPFKLVCALTALAATALLAGCGGGGAKDPFDTGPSAPPLVINPTSATVYSNTPTVITISSGVAPFQAFTSDSVVLPVAQNIPGTLLTLVPANVNADTPVTVTVQDGAGRRSAVDVTVKPATLVGATEIIPLSNNTCGGASSGGGGSTPAATGPVGVCSGETATAKVTLRAANTSVIPNRQVRFDVVFGNFQFVSDANGSNPSNTVTLVTDQNGSANALIKTADGIASQAAMIRVTDLVTGNRVDTGFTIVQKINGEAVLSVVPGSYRGRGGFQGQCGGTSGDFLVYGGRPPYTARSSLPDLVILTVNGLRGDPVTIPNSGGSFRASTNLQFCTGYTAQIVVTDAAGRNVTVSYTEEEGSTPLPTPAGLVISPKTVSLNCAPNRAINFVVSGGVSPYSLTTSRPGATAVNGSTVIINPTGSSETLTAVPPNNTFTVEVTDSRSAQTTATVTCIP